MTIRAYDDIIDFIASGTTPEKVVAFKPSPDAQRRVSELLNREKLQSLSDDEKSELDNFMMLEHLMRMAKARALKILSDS